MRNILAIFLIAAGLSSCTNDKAVEKAIVVNVEADEQEEKGQSQELTLNNGNKWKIDRSTHNNVVNLQNILNAFTEDGSRPLSDYQEVQLDLKNGIDKMIKECHMTGPDHEVLHHWLKPLINKVADLKKANTVADASRSLKNIRAQVKLNAQYFEYN
ncbi:MAG: hypothetical protein ABIN91_00495 [Mucilaginibacter sp.]|uniref:hypothetical protein n=1 Tax=Mucilaginibacter sp. TaxID=1882438 RepID=UPI0032673814